MMEPELSAGEIIARLELRPHPEGGYYRETFRDQRVDAQGRSCSTSIYFLLASGDRSAYLDNIQHQAFNVVTQSRLNVARALTCSGSTVTGRTAPVTLGQALTDWHVGQALTLAVLNINCENPNGPVTITIQPGSVSVVLISDD